MRDTILFVMAHGATQAVFDRHLPHWLRLRLPIIVLMPRDDPVKTDLRTIDVGESSHSGPKAKERLRGTLEAVLDSGADHALIFEYDSIYLGERLDLRIPYQHIQGIIHENKEPNRFFAPRYCIAPWSMDCHTAWKLHCSDRHTNLIEEGFQDRLISAWADIASVPMVDYDPPGMAENNFTPEYYPEIRRRVAAGCNWVHGMKTEEALQVVLEAKASRQ